MSSDSSQNALMAVSVEGLSPRARDIHSRVAAFIQKHIQPMQSRALQKQSDTEFIMNTITELQAKARQQGLWNLFLPVESDPERKYGAGLSNVEYAHICELMGKCPLSPVVFNCQAPDTGNMEVLVRYGTEEQKRTWLQPMLQGKIRSCFAMTEPGVASSDASNICASVRRDGDEYVINGHKWWTSGAMDPVCKLCIFMGKTDESAPRHKQHTMILVPMDAPGVKVVRPLSVFGLQDELAGYHAEVIFTDVRVPASNIILGEGRGFEIAQGRLGPGRIHHCMRLIGNAELALELMLQRTMDRVAFGKPLATQGTIQADVARSRLEIEQARLLVLKAAHKMDLYGNRVAAPEIAMIKAVTPSMTLRVLDRAIQAFGGAGLGSDLPLAAMFVSARALRIADGPDEVHLRTVARIEYALHHHRQRKAKL